MNNNNTIKFYLGDENRLVVEDNSQDSLFQEQYNNLFKGIAQIMPDIYCEKDMNVEDKVAVERTVNNVFAFIGERGSGKSSCMISAAEMLKNGEDEVVKTIHKSDKDSGTLTFEVLETIDPSFFDEKVNILEIILGKMFSKFLEKVEKDSCGSLDDSEKKKNNLFESFQKVKNCLCQLNHQDISEDDSVERLVDLAASVKMQSAFQLLVNRYLDLVKKDVLVIPIDDIDLHVTGAYKMVEQIRKYLIQKNVIVMMALKLEQLEKVLENEYLQQYKSVIDKGMLSKDRITEMAAKYLIKFIPQSHRIFMPDMNIGINRKITLYKFPKGSESDEIVDDIKDAPLKDCITKLIFGKTRYLFFHSNGLTNFIVPTNLREIRHLISMLCQMGNDVEINQQHFQHYFYDTWCKNNLDTNGNFVIREIFAIEDSSIFNKRIIGLLQTRFSSILNENTQKRGEGFEYTNEEIYWILKMDNVSYNISLGDVVLVINFLKERVTNHSDRMLLFAIETIYSFKIYSCYLNKEYNNDYYTLLGGSFINDNFYWNYTGDETCRLMPKNNRGIARDCYMIQMGLLKNYFTDHILTIAENDDAGILKIQMIELLSLLISRNKYNLKKKNTKEQNYRVQKEKYYQSAHTNQTVWLDVASFLYNITNIQQAYSKVDERLYLIANNYSDSLLNRFRRYVSPEMDFKLFEEPFRDKIEQEKQEDNNLYKESYLARLNKHFSKFDSVFQSQYSIRSLEILNDLIYHLTYRIDADNATMISNLQSFFNRLAKFEKSKYGDGNIDFKFVSVITEFLKAIEDTKNPELSQSLFEDFENLTKSVEEIDFKQLSSALKKAVSDKTAANLRKYVKEHYPSFNGEDRKNLLEQCFPTVQKRKYSDDEIDKAVANLEQEING